MAKKELSRSLVGFLFEKSYSMFSLTFTLWNFFEDKNFGSFKKIYEKNKFLRFYVQESLKVHHQLWQSEWQHKNYIPHLAYPIASVSMQESEKDDGTSPRPEE